MLNQNFYSLKTNTMKKLLTISLFLVSFIAQAQRFDWVTTAGYATVANSYYGALAIARDSQGNLYTLDGANGPQQCQGVTAQPYNGGITTFLYKFNASGELQYIKPIGVNFYPLNLQVGENDNLYLLGALWGGSTLIVDGVTINGIANRNYILKFDPSGSLLWNVPNNESFGGYASACMLQYHNNHIYFQTGNLSVSKLDINGQYVSTLTADAFIPSTAINGIHFKGSGVFSNGDMLFTAVSRGTLTYGSTTLNPVLETGSAPLLMLRTNDSLIFQLATYVNGVGDPAENFIPVTIGNDDGIYLGVEVNSTLIAGTDTIVNPGPGSTNYTDGILKLDETGTPVWLKSVTTNAHSWSVLNNPDGSGVFCGGDFTGELTLGDFTINAANGRSYIAKIDYDGTFQNAFAFVSGNEMGSKVKSMATNNEGVFYVGGKLSGISNPIFSCTPRDPNKGLYLGKFTEEPDAAPLPSITLAGGLLTASPVFTGSIQWFLNGDTIPGATNQTHTAAANGNYTVAYSYIPACVSVSGVKAFTTLGTDDNQLNSLSIYPNPFRNEVIVELHESIGPATLTICDFSGRKLVQKEISDSSQTLDMSAFSNGVYIFQFQNAKGIISKRLIKSN
jgi:hypothetical protein